MHDRNERRQEFIAQNVQSIVLQVQNAKRHETVESVSIERRQKVAAEVEFDEITKICESAPSLRTCVPDTPVNRDPDLGRLCP